MNCFSSNASISGSQTLLTCLHFTGSSLFADTWETENAVAGAIWRNTQAATENDLVRSWKQADRLVLSHTSLMQDWKVHICLWGIHHGLLEGIDIPHFRMSASVLEYRNLSPKNPQRPLYQTYQQWQDFSSSLRELQRNLVCLHLGGYPPETPQAGISSRILGSQGEFLKDCRHGISQSWG